MPIQNNQNLQEIIDAVLAESRKEFVSINHVHSGSDSPKIDLNILGSKGVATLENTGAKLPFANNEPGGIISGKPWSSPTNAYTDDGTYAIANQTVEQKFHLWRKFDGLREAIPGGATIQGIEVEVQVKVDTGTSTLQAQLSKDGATTVGTNETSSSFGTTDSVRTLGSSTNLWGTTWTPGDFGNNFGVVLNGTDVGTHTYSVDYIKVTVYYTTIEDHEFTGNFIPSTDDVYDIGSSAQRVNTLYARRIDGLKGMILKENRTFTDDFNIENLTSNTQKIYKLYISYYNATGRTCSLKFNDDTGNNYHVVIHEFGEVADADVHTGESEANAAQGDITLTRGLKRVSIEITIMAGNTLRPIVIAHSFEENDDDDLNFVMRNTGANWDTANEITKINVDLSGTVTTGEYWFYEQVQ